MAECKATMMGKRGGVGGLFGIIPTVDVAKARRAYMDYIENFTGTDSERLDFKEFARRWKRQKS